MSTKTRWMMTTLLVMAALAWFNLAFSADANASQAQNVEQVTYKIIAIVACGLLATGFWRWAASLNDNFEKVWTKINHHSEAIVKLETNCRVTHQDKTE